MRILLAVFILLITYGSLYPFDFDLNSYVPLHLEYLLYFGIDASGRGDLIANILLFIPIGVITMQMFPGRSVAARLILILPLSFAFAFVIQVPQLVIPGRVPAGSDAVWNLIGCAIGCLVGLTPVGSLLKKVEGKVIYPSIPVLLALMWLTFNLAPFIPSIDFQLLKDNLKLIFSRAPEELWIFQSMTMWLIVFHFLKYSDNRFLREKNYPLLVGIIILASFFIVGNSVTAEKLIGGFLAILVWPVIRKFYQPFWLAIALVITLTGINFTPFELREFPTEFKWVPFSGALSGNLFNNVLATFKKLMMYGSLIWLLVECRLTLRVSTILTALFLLLGEFVQIYFVNTTPEITDALLAIAIGVTFHQYHLRGRRFTQGEKNAEQDSSNKKAVEQTLLSTRDEEVSASYIPGMDGLRAIAALAVFFVHFNQQVGLQYLIGPFDLQRWLSNGNTGVALFFVLSGLLLSLPFWQAKLGKSPAPNIKDYAWRRAGRILPAYYLCLFTILFAKSIAGSDTSWNNILSHLIFVYNLSDWNILSLNQPFWTLAVEAQFYVILPILFLLLRKVSTNRATWVILFLIPALYLLNHGVVSAINASANFPVNQLLIWPFSLHISKPDSFVLTYSTLGHLPHFLIGVITARLFLYLIANQRHMASSRGLFDLLFWLGCVAVFVILSTPIDDVLEIPHGRYNFPFVPLLIAAIVISVPFSRSARAVLSWRLAAWLGAISYGIYIYHYPIQKVISRAMSMIDYPVNEHVIVFGVSSLVVTVLCSQLSYSVLEVPAMRWVKNHLRRGKLAPQEGTQGNALVSEEKANIEVRTERYEAITSETTNSAIVGSETTASDPVSAINLLKLNLHQYQYDFLLAFALANSLDQNQLCRQIIILADKDNASRGQNSSLKDDATMFPIVRSNADWTVIKIELDPDSWMILTKLASDKGDSHSSTLRHLIEAQIKMCSRKNALRRFFAFGKPAFFKRLSYKHAAVALTALLLPLILYGFFGGGGNKPEFQVNPSWAGYETDIIFDHHTHTTHSDGALTPSEIVKLGVDNGCNAMAITDHSYTAGSASVQQVQEIRKLREQYPKLLLFTGIELNMPSYKGREHVNIIVEPSYEKETLRRLGDEAENSILLASGNDQPKASDATTLDLIRKYQSQGINLITIYNHPSRKVEKLEESMHDLLRWDKENKIFTAISGAPGHQNAESIGSYDHKITTEDRWDPAVSQVGGVWDQLLASGSNVWGAIASSDYHNKGLDKPPCAFSRIHVATGDKSYTGLLAAIKSGTFWSDHGKILEQFHFRIELKGLSQPVYPGAVVKLNTQGDIAVVSISIKRGSGSHDAPLSAEVISNCRNGQTEVIYTSVIPPGVNDVIGLLPIRENGENLKSCFMRARMRLDVYQEPDLMAYTNPIRLLL